MPICFETLRQDRLSRTSETWKKIKVEITFGTYIFQSHVVLLVILDVSHYIHKIIKMAVISLNVMIGTCNKNQTLLSFSQSTLLTC